MSECPLSWPIGKAWATRGLREGSSRGGQHTHNVQCRKMDEPLGEDQSPDGGSDVANDDRLVLDLLELSEQGMDRRG